MSDYGGPDLPVLTPEHSGTSDLACDLCKRRKTKCDRTLPACGSCTRSTQSCVYPSKRLKPGPKLGSHIRERKRPRDGLEPQARLARHKLGDADSGDYDQANEAGPSRTRSQKQTVLSLPTPTRARNAASSYLASLPPSPKSTDGAEMTDMSDVSESSDIAATNFVRAISLSSLIHPIHESLDPSASGVAQSLPVGFFINLVGAQNMIVQACEIMNVSVSGLQCLTDLYFDNMTAFSLFHRPSFGSKIQGVKNSASLIALLAAMFSISVRFYAASPDFDSTSESVRMPSSDYFHQMALRYVDEVLKDIGDEIPSLVVLQAMAVCSFNELMRGARGKGWRLLGSCVRIAYEQRLHLIDYEGRTSPPSSTGELQLWLAKEEQRRCWWAIWEMDVFASTIQRAPLAIDWSMNETYLPIDDDSWFANRHCQSCFLDLQPGERWKKLKRSGNRSPVSWFIILSSIMRDAQARARGSLQGIRSQSGGKDDLTALQQYFRNVFRKKPPVAGDQELCSLSQALQQTVSAMPQNLAYKGEKLSFAADEVGLAQPNSPDVSSTKFLHASRYSIYLMTQLARYQIFHHYAFGEIASGTLFTESPADPPFGWTSARPHSPGQLPNLEGLRNCLEAGDNVFAILKKVPEWHVKYVNPFLASTVWLATSFQVLRKVYTLAMDDQDKSKFALLRLTCQRYAVFWGTPLTLLDNVDSLEKHLMRRREIMAEMEARCKEKQRAARAKDNASTAAPGFGDQESGLQSRKTETSVNDSSEPLDMATVPDISNLESLLSSAKGLSAMANVYSLSPLSSAVPFLDLLPDFQNQLGNTSELLDPSYYPTLSTSQQSGETEDLRNGFDLFMTELMRSQ